MANHLYSRTGSVLLGAGVLGAIVGIGSIASAPEAQTSAETVAGHPAVSTGMIRSREPASGDRWAGCDDARAAGAAPIYRGEPGYRPDIDGDDDGIACESRRS